MSPDQDATPAPVVSVRAGAAPASSAVRWDRRRAHGSGPR
ncbi:D-amino-acid dehydrogenase [Actinomyces sp. oral taxon 178 str. F0338]|nr:D-amino-acid dehydrogenase [Actinomyces sp. oral taxon 178 str. F0338]